MGLLGLKEERNGPTSIPICPREELNPCQTPSEKLKPLSPCRNGLQKRTKRFALPPKNPRRIKRIGP